MPKSKEEYWKQYWKGRKASRDQVRDIAKILDANETDASKFFACVLSKYFEGDGNVEQEDRYNSAIHVLNSEKLTHGEEADLRKTVAKQLRSKVRHGGFSTICNILGLNDAYLDWLGKQAPTDLLLRQLPRFLAEKFADKEALIPPSPDNNSKKSSHSLSIDDLSESESVPIDESFKKLTSRSCEIDEKKIGFVFKQNCTLNDLENSFRSEVVGCRSGFARALCFKEKEDLGSLTSFNINESVSSISTPQQIEEVDSDVLQYTYSESANGGRDRF